MVVNRIREVRNKLGMTQERVSDFTGGQGKTVMSLIENGHVMPTKEMLKGFCDAFGCSPYDLYNVEDLDLAGFSKEYSHGIQLSEDKYEELSVKAIRAGFSGVDDWFDFAVKALNVLSLCTYGGSK